MITATKELKVFKTVCLFDVPKVYKARSLKKKKFQSNYLLVSRSILCSLYSQWSNSRQHRTRRACYYLALSIKAIFALGTRNCCPTPLGFHLMSLDLRLPFFVQVLSFSVHVELASPNKEALFLVVCPWRRQVKGVSAPFLINASVIWCLSFVCV